MTNQRLEQAALEAHPMSRRSTPHPGSGRRKEIDRNKVRDLTQAGHTAEQIAHTLECSTSSINQIRKQLGITHPRMLTPEKRAAIEEALSDGWSHAEISRTIGTTHETIERHFPGSAWTHEQRAEHIRTLRTVRTDCWGALPTHRRVA